LWFTDELQSFKFVVKRFKLKESGLLIGPDSSKFLVEFLNFLA